MLTELRVHNLALIEKAELELGPGLTVLTGETGAGKTALLSSLKLLIGERGDSTMVGAGDSEARVEAVFTVPSGEGSAAQEEYVIVRKLSAEGRSRCYLDDSLVTVGRLNEVVGPHVDLYGQHEHQSLLKAQEQLAILDAFGKDKTGAALQAYKDAWKDYTAKKAQLQTLQELASSSGAQREQAAFVVREIEKIAPQQGEYEELESSLPRLQNGEQLAHLAGEALEYLRGEGGALEKLSQAMRALETIQTMDTILDEGMQQAAEHLVGLEEIANDISKYASNIEYDPAALQQALDRLGELDGLSRRFGPGMEQVLALWEHSKSLMQSTEESQETLEAALQECEQAKAGLETAAQALATERAKASKALIEQLNESIKNLALAGASLEFALHNKDFKQWTSEGSQSFELLYRPAPNAEARPLAKIASGGELSRVMLALKSILQTTEQPMTLVFDEIDAGVGGKTAVAVAQRLAQLATQHQVIVITHLAQIAARAQQHYLVSKTTTKNKTQTTISLLDNTQREEEIARMLSGSTSSEALVHAQTLLREAKEAHL